MGCVLTVTGTVHYGRLKESGDQVGPFIRYRQQRGWAGSYSPTAVLALVLAHRLDKRVEGLFCLEERP